ncbi:MAG TPA: 50S ribosomal protein L4 [Actinomycetota bacterium]
MATVDVFDPAGSRSGSRELPDEIFASAVNVPLMHQVVVTGLASLRAGTHSTKTRGEVSGGGKKPWRQKGTGRARQGSIRSPQWVGGGISHGPQPRSHDLRINKKMKRGALRSALTDALQSGKVVVIEDPSFEVPKTREAVALLRALELGGKVLVVLPEPHEATEKSFRNLTTVRVTFAPSLSTYDVLRADRVVFTTSALDVLEGKAAATAVVSDEAAGDDGEAEA